MTSIGEGAFRSCSGLTTVISEIPAENLFTIESSVFNGIDKENCILYVPVGAVDTYSSTPGWNNFSNIEEWDNWFTVTYIIDGELYSTAEIEYGTEIPLPAKEGHTFNGSSEIPATMPAKDIIIEGTFTVNSYTITYMLYGEVYATETVEYGSELTPIVEPEVREGYTFSGWSGIPTTMPAEDITVTGSFAVKSYTVTYIIDSKVYSTVNVAYGAKIPLPAKEGHTFNGSSEIPATMPAGDITIEGTFTKKSYTVTYILDGEEYEIFIVKYGAAIPTVEVEGRKGYTFSGWSEIPERMPANDITIEGKFTAKSYTVTYIVDGKVYAKESVRYGAGIPAVDEPVKEGYTFSGWDEMPATMPAKNITIEGSFTVNSYTVTYMLYGEIYATETVEYGAKIPAVDEPVKEGHTFSGWNDVPAKMPAEDIIIEGTFTVNSYTVTYILDGEVYATETVEYGSELTPIAEPEAREGHTFSGWSGIPATMPAEDITIEGSFAVNSYIVIYIVDGEVYEAFTVEYGAEIPAVDEPAKEGYTFSGWSEVPATMPAENITVTGSFTKDETGIGKVSDDGEKVVYDLNGRRIVDTEHLEHGIYIVDGKKVLVK